MSTVVPFSLHPERAIPARLLASLSPGVLAGELGPALDALCQQTAALLAAEVVSVYGVQADGEGDALVVRGNVGFPSEVVGTLRLAIGEGVVGWAAATLRPVAVDRDTRAPHFRAVRGLDEERLPVMLAVPLCRRGRLLGVLAVQRAEDRPFVELELTVAGLLAESAALLIEAEQSRAGERHSAAIALRGVGSGGIGFGRVDLVPTAASLAARAHPGAAAVEQALGRLTRDIERLAAGAAEPALARSATAMALTLSDGRLRDHLIAAARGGRRIADVARAYARAPYAHFCGVDPEAVARAADLEELCVVVQLIAEGALARQSGRVWCGERAGGFVALAAASYAAGLVIDGDGEVTDEARAIAAAAGLPLVGGVDGLFAWVRPDDLLLVEGERGVVRVNPASTRLAAARAARRATP